MESIYDCFKLNNDMKIPCVGFGTYKAAEGNNVEILKTAIEAGYRYFDTASFYQTEEFVGQAIRESNLPRGISSLYPRCGKMKWDTRMRRQHARKAWKD